MYRATIITILGVLQGNPAVDASGRRTCPIPAITVCRSTVPLEVMLQLWAAEDREMYQFGCPGEISISPVNGDIYVADQCNQRVQVFTSARSL